MIRRLLPRRGARVAPGDQGCARKPWRSTSVSRWWGTSTRAASSPTSARPTASSSASSRARSSSTSPSRCGKGSQCLARPPAAPLLPCTKSAGAGEGGRGVTRLHCLVSSAPVKGLASSARQCILRRNPMRAGERPTSLRRPSTRLRLIHEGA